MLNDNLRGVGSFYRCWHLARELVRLGHEVCLATVSRDRRILPWVERNNGLKLVESPNLLDLVYGVGPGYGILGIPYRMLALAGERYDVVHAFESRPNVWLPAMLSRALNQCPLVVDWADWWGTTRDGSGLHERKAWPLPYLENGMEEFFHRNADWVTAISTGLRDRAISLGIPAERVTVIPSGAPVDAIPSLDIEVCRRELKIHEETYLLGFVGSQVADLDMLSPAIRKLRRVHPKVKLGLIGPPRGALLGSSLQDAVISFGPVDFSRLPLYLGACDAFVLPQRDTVFNRTRWPNKFGDFLAAGRPILCSNVGDVAQIVAAEGCGITYDDLTEFVRETETLMDDKPAAQAMGAAARNLAEGPLSWRKIAMDFLSVYEAVTA